MFEKLKSLLLARRGADTRTPAIIASLEHENRLLRFERDHALTHLATARHHLKTFADSSKPQGNFYRCDLTYTQKMRAEILTVLHDELDASGF